MQSSQLPVLPVAPAAFLIGGKPGARTQIGPFVFPHSVVSVPPMYFTTDPVFAAPSVPREAISREAKNKCNEKLKQKEHIIGQEPPVVVTARIPFGFKPAKRGRKPKNHNNENEKMVENVAPPPPSPEKKKALKIDLNYRHYQELENGVVRVRDTRLEPHQFRTMVDINGRRWLVFVRFSLQVEPGVYAYELFFVGRYRKGLRARYVGRMDVPLSDGRMLFEPVQTLHNLNLDQAAWWVLNKTRMPYIGKQPGPAENPYLPIHVLRNEHGVETHEPAPFEPNDFVTFVWNDSESRGYILARHDPVCLPASRLYVLLSVDSAPFVVHTVYHKDIRPPKIQDVLRPRPGELWWKKQYDACMCNAFIKLHMEFCLPPREGFKRGNIVSVPNASDPQKQRVCACIAHTWIVDGRIVYRVVYPSNEGTLYKGLKTEFHTQDLLGPSTHWKLSDFTFDLSSANIDMMLDDLGTPSSPEVGEKRALSPSSLSPINLGPPAADVQPTPHKVRRITIVETSSAPASPFRPIPVVPADLVVALPPPLLGEEPTSPAIQPTAPPPLPGTTIDPPDDFNPDIFFAIF